MTAVYYAESGRFSVRGLALGLLVGAAVGAVFASVYAYAVLYIPLVEIRIFLTAGFGVLTGLFAGAAPLRLGKIRNARLRRAAVAVVVVLTWYLSWAVWVFAFLRRGDVAADLGAIVLQPDLLWRLIVRINEVGAWRLRGVTPTGIVLWAVWSVEALMIVWLGVTLGYIAGYTEPFCEACGRWCEKTDAGARVAAGDSDEIKRRLETKDTAFLEQLGAPTADATAWVRMDLWSCTGCGGTNTLDAAAVTVTVDKEGKRREGRRGILQNLLLTKDEAARFRTAWQRLAGTAAGA